MDHGDDVDTLVTRHLEAWNAPPGPARTAAVAATYTDDVLVGEPTSSDRGHAGMERAISGLQEQAPGATITRRGPVQVAQEMVTYAWGLGASPDTPVATGRDVLLVREGRIAALYVVVDTP